MNRNRPNIIKRLKSARGHLDRVIKMTEDNEYCITVLQQSLAVQAALKRADEELLTHHLNHCVKKALEGREKNKQLKEIVEVFKRGRK